MDGRVPLKETTSNVRKKSHVKATTRLNADELKAWQRQWRSIMNESVVYFENDDKIEAQKSEKMTAKKCLESLGAYCEPFFTEKVTIIISRRPYQPEKNSYPSGDPFNWAIRKALKVWSYEKVFRFLRNLGVDIQAPHLENKKLTNLLQEEKLHGPSDRDPLAKRDDVQYLKGEFFHVFDLTQVHRPVVLREWHKSKYKEPYFPHLYASTNGRSPFQCDPENTNDYRKKCRRLQFLAQNKEYRQRLIEASTGKKSPKRYKKVERGASAVLVAQAMAPPAALSRNDSVISKKGGLLKDFGEIQASGVQLSTAQSGGGSKNGLGPFTAQVDNRKVESGKKRLVDFPKKRKGDVFAGKTRSELYKAYQKVNKESKSGYCENCRLKYDSFDKHIVSGKHRSFALDQENFAQIDSLIKNVEMSRLMRC